MNSTKVQNGLEHSGWPSRDRVATEKRYVRSGCKCGSRFDEAVFRTRRRIENLRDGNHLAMLIGFVMVLALLTVGFGYVVFEKTAAHPGLVWDVGFLASLTAFLACFIVVIWRHAERQLNQDAVHSRNESRRNR